MCIIIVEGIKRAGKPVLFFTIILSNTLQWGWYIIKNQLDDIDISLNKFEKELKYIETPDTTSRAELTERNGFPYINETLMELLIENQKVPSPFDVFVRYLHNNEGDYNVKEALGRGFKRQLRDRVYRAYYSLIREIHFAMMLSDLDLKVVYSTEIDLDKGIDVLIDNQGITYGLHLFLDSKRSIQHRQRKKRSEYDVDVSIEVPFTSGRAVGGFDLYTTEYIVDVLEEIIKYHGKVA